MYHTIQLPTSNLPNKVWYFRTPRKQALAIAACQANKIHFVVTEVEEVPASALPGPAPLEYDPLRPGDYGTSWYYQFDDWFSDNVADINAPAPAEPRLAGFGPNTFALAA